MEGPPWTAGPDHAAELEALTHRLANARSEAANTHLLLTRRAYGYLAAPKITDATP